MDLEIRRVRRDDWPALKDVRLRALADAPFAFQTTYAEAAGRADETWQERAAETEQAETTVMYVVAGHERFHGMAGGFIEGTPARADLVSVWLEPGQRGTGAGEALVRAVAGWAHERGFAEIFLWVTAGNMPAIRLYERLGFRFTGNEQPIPGRDGSSEQEMVGAVGDILQT